jgi:hypothetical protein
MQKKSFLGETENLILFVIYALRACIIEIQVLQKCSRKKRETV